MSTPNRIMTGNAPQEVQMTRLSKSLLDQLGVRLEHSDLKKLGYRAEKRPNNPNTYYKVPGLHANIENCPKVIKYIRQVFLQNKKQELEKLLGKGVAPKLPPSNSRRGAAAADAAPEDQDDGDDDEDEDEEEDSSDDEDEEMEEVQEEAAAADDGSRNLAPPGFVFVTGEKQDKVLEGMASYISAQTHLKGVTGPDLHAKGMRGVEESRPLAPGERMRHAFVWWHGKMDEPLRCAQYIFAAKNLLDMEKAREALGLPPLAPGKASGGSASVPAKKRPSSASEGMLTPPAAASSAAAAAKRTRTSTGELASKTPAAPASAPPASNAAGPDRLGRSTKASQAAAAAAGGSSGAGAGSGAAGARASHFPVSPSQSGGAAAGGSAAAPAAAAGGKTRGSIKAAAAAAAGGSGAAAGGKAGGAAVKLGAGNQQVLDTVDDAVKLLGEALELARSLPPSVLNSLPSVFTAGLDGTLQEFLSAAVAMHEGLKADKELLISMASDYAAELASGGSSSGFGAAAAGSSSSRGRTGATAAAAAESHYRRPYLAFRAALGSCALDAHAWLQDKQQREMIARLEGLCQIKQQLEDKKSQEAQMRQEQEAMRQQKEKLEQELNAYKERLKQMEEEHRRKSAAAVAAVAAEAAAAAQQQQTGDADKAGAAGIDQAA